MRPAAVELKYDDRNHLVGSFDGAWYKRSSGHKYSSLGSFASLGGAAAAAAAATKADAGRPPTPKQLPVAPEEAHR